MNFELIDPLPASVWLQACSVSFGYPSRPIAQQALHSWPAGLCLIAGDEGSGKSSWLKALAGDLPLQAGQWRGRAVRHQSWDPAKHPAQVFWQDPRQPLAADQAQMLVSDWVQGQRSRYPWWSEPQWALHVQGFGLAEHLGKPLLALSTGTLRKLWMAAGWASGAPLVLIDEPLAALDKPSERYVQQALAAMAEALKDPAHPRCVIVAHWDVMQGVPWEDVLQLH